MNAIDIIIIISCLAFLIYVFFERKVKRKKNKFCGCQGCIACLKNTKTKNHCSIKNSPEKIKTVKIDIKK